jgi:hypothetical protein
VHATNSEGIRSSVSRVCGELAEYEVVQRYRWIRAALRPCVFGFTALALAVVFWGFSYKLSLYHPTRISRSNPAKIWIETHNRAQCVVRVFKADFKHLTSVSASAVSSELPPLVAFKALVRPVQGDNVPAFIAYLTSPRSPPSSLQA